MLNLNLLENQRIGDRTHLFDVGLQLGDGSLDELLLKGSDLADGLDGLDTLRL